VSGVTQFASSDELAARLGLTLTDDEITRAGILLALASGLIQTETSQTIAEVVDDELVTRSVVGERFRLPQRPVTAVTSVAIDETVLDANTWYLDGDELVRASWPAGSESYFFTGGYGRGFLGPLRTLTVVYSHGYETIPAVVKATTLEAVVRVWVNPGAVARETIGDVSTVYDNNRFSPSGLLLTDVEKAAVNGVVRRTENSIVLR
jgi:hypothetical protein